MHAMIRAYLRANPDGATKGELVKAMKAQLGTIMRAVTMMPDVCIDRWIQRPGCRAEAVHVAIEVPEDCPPPDLIGRRVRPREVQQEMMQ